MKVGRCPRCKRVMVCVRHCPHEGRHKFSHTKALCPEPDHLIRRHGCGSMLEPVMGSGQEASYRAAPTPLSPVKAAKAE